VIVTHGHEDHVGELLSLQHARIVVSSEGWQPWETWDRRALGLTRHFSPSLSAVQVLCTGDTLYTLRHLALDDVRPVTIAKRLWQQQADSIRRIQQLLLDLPDLVIAPAHDHSSYGERFLYPSLADGALSPDERQEIKEYEARLFNAAFGLVHAALPRYMPPTVRGGVGSVAKAVDSSAPPATQRFHG
jgi:glyoxylase-like metal-dependent hydrolase (beta-lactamase superfamily II)